MPSLINNFNNNIDPANGARARRGSRYHWLDIVIIPSL